MAVGLRVRRTRDRLATLPGVRSIRRPLTPAAAEHFDLFYVRTGPAGRTPLVIIPGGPGMASIAAYQGLRKRAAAAGLDVIMMEHRGVGMSRRDESGSDLPVTAVTITQVVDDLAAVLDDAAVDTAVVYGASYGSYLAAGFGVCHPDRLHAMVLDSPLLNRNDFELVRSHCRALWWHDESAVAAKVRRLAEAGRLTPEDLTFAAAVYGIAGPEVLERHLDQLLNGRALLWTAVRGITLNAAHRNVPFHSESDLAGSIGFRELNFAGTPDGLPLDTTLTWRGVPGADIPFEAEPFDLVAEMPEFRWPTVVVSGSRDMITPPPVAHRIADLVPEATLVRLPTAAHSILDTREEAAMRIIDSIVRGRADALPAQGGELDALPPVVSVRLKATALAVAPRLAAVLPRIGSAPVTS